MKFQITLNGAKVEKDIPESWDQVTFRQCIALIKCGDNDTKKISIFTGIDEETLLKSQINNLYTLLGVLSFLKKDMTYTMPTSILGYNLPQDLETESTAQYADLQLIIAGFDKDDQLKNIQTYPLIIATYVRFDGEYDYKKSETLVDKFFDAPCTEVMAVGNFTLARLLALKLNIPMPSRRAATPKSKLRRVLISWLYRLDFIIRYYSWKKRLPSPVKNYWNGR